MIKTTMQIGNEYVDRDFNQFNPQLNTSRLNESNGREINNLLEK